MIPVPENFYYQTKGKSNNINKFIIITVPVAEGAVQYFLSSFKSKIDTHPELGVPQLTTRYFEDRNLRLGAIKQSINMRTKKFSISNVAITLSNFLVNGERLSDKLSSNGNPLNCTVEIYYGAEGAIDINDLFKIYTGKIRRFSMDENLIRLSIEDTSQEDLHKDLPSVYMPDDDRTIDKYRNKPIPMVFGENDKSPLMYFKPNLLSKEFYWIPDNVYMFEAPTSLNSKPIGLKGVEGSLSAWKGDWVDVPMQRHTELDYLGIQWELRDNSYYVMEKDNEALEVIERKLADQGLSTEDERIIYLQQLSAITNDIFEGHTIKSPRTITVLDKFIPEGESNENVDIYYKGETGVQGNTEEVHLNQEDPNSNAVSFPALTEEAGGGSIYRGFTLSEIAENMLDYSGDAYLYGAEDTGGHGANFLATGNLYKLARDNGWWVSRLPTPSELLDDFCTTWLYENGYTLSDVNQGYINNPSEFNSSHYNLGHYNLIIGPGSGYFDKYESSGNNPAIEINLINNSILQEWWLGSNAFGPVIKDWSQESYDSMGTVTHSYSPMGNFSYMISIEYYKSILIANEYYNMGKFFSGGDYGQPYSFYPYGDDFSGYAGPDGEHNWMIFYNHSDGIFQTALHSAYGNWFTPPHDYSIGSPSIVSDRGYLSTDDPNRTGILSNTSLKESVKVTYNFPDLEAEDLVPPIRDKDNNVKIKTYRNLFSITSSTDIKKPDGVTGVGDFEIDTDHHGQLNSVSLSSIASGGSTVENSIGENLLESGSWLNANDFNQASLNFRCSASGGNNEVQIISQMQEPSLKHEANYSELETTSFYGHIKGRTKAWKYFDSYMPDDGNVFDLNIANPSEILNELGAPGGALVFPERWDIKLIGEENWNIRLTLPIQLANQIDDFVQPVPNIVYDIKEINSPNLSIFWLMYRMLWSGWDLEQIDPIFTGYGRSYWLEKFTLEWDAIQQFQFWIHEGYEQDVLTDEILVKVFQSTAPYIQEAISSTYQPNGGGVYVEKPADIISYLYTNELGFSGEINDAIKESNDLHYDWKFGFTVDKKTNSKALIESLAKNSKTYTKIRPQDGSLSFVTLKDEYVAEDVNMFIDKLDVISFSFDKTKLDDLSSKVKVFYKKDPERDDFELSTDYALASNFMEHYDINYYSVSNEEDIVLDFESDFIRNEQTAVFLRNHLLMYNCNQKLTMKLKIPLKYANLETGDIVFINGMINDLKAYGANYTVHSMINGQLVFPYFIVTSISISDNISLELEQLHYLGTQSIVLEDYLSGLGYSEDDINSIIDENIPSPAPESSVVEGCTYVDAENYDPNANMDDGSCVFSESVDYVPGDFNGDGELTVLDLVAIVQEILYGNTVASAPNSNNLQEDFIAMHTMALKSYDETGESFYNLTSNKPPISTFELNYGEGGVFINKNGYFASLHIEFTGGVSLESKLNDSYHIYLGPNKIIILLFGDKDVEEELFEYAGNLNITKTYAYDINGKKVNGISVKQNVPIWGESKTVWETSSIVWGEASPKKTSKTLKGVSNGITKLKNTLTSAKYRKEVINKKDSNLAFTSKKRKEIDNG